MSAINQVSWFTPTDPIFRLNADDVIGLPFNIEDNKTGKYIRITEDLTFQAYNGLSPIANIDFETGTNTISLNDGELQVKPNVITIENKISFNNPNVSVDNLVIDTNSIRNTNNALIKLNFNSSTDDISATCPITANNLIAKDTIGKVIVSNSTMNHEISVSDTTTGNYIANNLSIISGGVKSVDINPSGNVSIPSLASNSITCPTINGDYINIQGDNTGNPNNATIRLQNGNFGGQIIGYGTYLPNTGNGIQITANNFGGAFPASSKVDVGSNLGLNSNGSVNITAGTSANINATTSVNMTAGANQNINMANSTNNIQLYLNGVPHPVFNSLKYMPRFYCNNAPDGNYNPVVFDFLTFPNGMTAVSPSFFAGTYNVSFFTMEIVGTFSVGNATNFGNCSVVWNGTVLSSLISNYCTGGSFSILGSSMYYNYTGHALGGVINAIAKFVS